MNEPALCLLRPARHVGTARRIGWLVLGHLLLLAVSVSARAGEQARELPFPLIERFESFGVPEGLPAWKVHCVLAAGERVWVGTSKGLALREGGRFRVIGPGQGLSHAIVTALALAPDSGDLWIGTMRGLNRWSAGRLTAYTQLNSGLPNDVVYGVVVAGDVVWVATAAGLGRLDLKAGRWSLFDHTNTVMHEPWCYAVAHSPERLYVGVWGGGIVEHDLARGTWKEHRDPDREMELDLLPDDGPVHNVTSFVGWAEGILWQTTYFGLSRYDGSRWKTFQEGKSPLVSNFISFVEPRGTNAWLGTDSGLVVTDGANWATYRRDAQGRGRLDLVRAGGDPETRAMATALPDNFVLGASVGAQDLWITTSHGLARGVFARPGEVNLSASQKQPGKEQHP